MHAEPVPRLVGLALGGGAADADLGGEGRDTLVYTSADLGITIDLVDPQAYEAPPGAVLLLGIDRERGSAQRGAPVAVAPLQARAGAGSKQALDEACPSGVRRPIGHWLREHD